MLTETDKELLQKLPEDNCRNFHSLYSWSCGGLIFDTELNQSL